MTLHGNVSVIGDYPILFQIRKLLPLLQHRWIIGFLDVEYHWSFIPIKDEILNQRCLGKVARLFGPRKTGAMPLHLRGRFNRKTDRFFVKVVDSDQRNWDSLISLFLLSYQSSIHKSTRETPAKRASVILWFGIRYSTTEIKGDSRIYTRTEGPAQPSPWTNLRTAGSG